MSTAIDTPPVQIVQQHLEALNAHDLGVFCALCDREIRVEDADGTLLLNGIAEFRAWYSSHFADNPELKSDLLDRISLGDWVIDENLVTGFADGSQLHVVITMRVAHGLIQLMRVIR